MRKWVLFFKFKTILNLTIVTLMLEISSAAVTLTLAAGGRSKALNVCDALLVSVGVLFIIQHSKHDQI